MNLNKLEKDEKIETPCSESNNSVDLNKNIQYVDDDLEAEMELAYGYRNFAIPYYNPMVAKMFS